MSKLRIKDAPILPNVDGSEKIPTGGKGDYSVTLDQVKAFARGGLPQQLEDHINDTSNPHQVTKDQVGLGNVDNTSDINKPVSTATQEALDLKADQTYVDEELNLKANSVDVENSLSLKLDKSEKGQSGGLATLDSSGKVPRDELPPFVDLTSTVPTFSSSEAGVDPVTGVEDGGYYNVRSSLDENYIDEYQNVGGIPTPSGKSYPSSNAKWRADQVISLNGKNQQDINNNTAYFYQTVAQMVADIKLTDGMIVTTKGYHNIFDDGGATYLVSNIATDYSIPISNGLHAAFRDTFDIRKFGIVSNKTLDQTALLTRMVNYADSREYEIDFHNFEIMTPETQHFTTNRGAVIKGMGFKKPHHIKNLFIANDKTKNLFSGTCPIHFIPDDPTGYGLFKLSNVTFDPYHQDFTLASGEGDGMLFGFHVMWHPDAGLSWPDDHQFVTGYELEFDDIHFASPAISYNLACAGFFTKSIKAKNLTGDYWGIYLVHHTYSLDIDGIHGIFRDDLHTGSGRLLVTNLIHEEAEIGSGIITRNLISVKNASCYRKSDGSVHVVYKCHRIGTITINNFIAENYIGRLEFYSGDTPELQAKLKILNFTAKNSPSVLTVWGCEVVNATFDNFDVCTSFVLHSNFTNLTLNNIRRFVNAINIIYKECETLTVTNCGEVLDATYGLIRSTAKVKNIIISGITCNNRKFIDCSFETMQISKLNTEITTTFNNFILNSPVAGFLPATAVIKDSKIYATGGVLLNLSAGGVASISSSHLVGNFSYGSATLADTSVKKTVTYDPPSLTNATQQSTTVALTGAKLGDNINVAFDKALSGTRMWGEVTSANTVTVYHRNDTGAVVDVPSGTLTVKLV